MPLQTNQVGGTRRLAGFPIVGNPTANQHLQFNATLNVFEWVSPGGSLEILDNYVAPGAESGHTFTPGTPLSTVDYSKFIIEIDGRITAALALQLVINGLGGTLYDGTAWTSDGSAITPLPFANDSEAEIVGSGILSSANQSFAGTIEVYIAEANTRPFIISRMTRDDGRSQFTCFHVDAITSTIISLRLQTSTSTWLEDTKISIYGVNR